jgi:chemotaxis protein MotB
MSDAGPKIIIVKKKAKGHAAHHGGSWKVAYADFVTAMMAFFLVMWIMGMEEGARDIVQGYFQNPVGFQRSFSGGKNMLSQGNIPAQVDIRTTLTVQRQQEFTGFEAAAEEIKEALRTMNVEGAEVETLVTREGLRIEMMETGSQQVFFDRSSARLKEMLVSILEQLAPELAKLPNPIIIEGHTDAAPFGGRDYTNWELSTDRANAARRLLERSGLGADRIVGVRGLADRDLKESGDAFAPRNRRVTILLNFMTPDPEDREVLERLGIQTNTVDLSPVGTAAGDRP